MVVGYAGHYLCRSDLSVALPLIVEAKHGIPAPVAKVRLSTIDIIPRILKLWQPIF
jgi:sugar phosphate permease